jgi:hypothetical protein
VLRELGVMTGTDADGAPQYAEQVLVREPELLLSRDRVTLQHGHRALLLEPLCTQRVPAVTTAWWSFDDSNPSGTKRVEQLGRPAVESKRIAP